MRQWTEDQSKVIESRGSNLLVSAAAGSGKTAVLVERIIRLIEEGTDVDRMLVVTFTKAAAGEMRERIMDGLSERMERLWEAGEDESKEAQLPSAVARRKYQSDFLRGQILKLGNASIMTIHAFCSDVINSYFYMIDLSPDFKVGDEAETEALRLEALDDAMEAAYDSGDQDFSDLAESFATDRSDTRLREMVLKLYDFMMSKPAPFQWLSEAVAVYDCAIESEEAFNVSAWVSEVMNYCQGQLEELQMLAREAVAICRLEGGPAPYAPALESDLIKLDSLVVSSKKGFDPLMTDLSDVSFDRLKAFKPVTPFEEEQQDRVKKLRELVKEGLKGLSESFYGKGSAYFRRQIRVTGRAAVAMENLVNDFAKRYEALKREKGTFDFSDLEHKAIELIRISAVQEALRERYAYLFVDEYQDTNEVQEFILGSIARENNRFMVGDIKQSIYKFRLADPTIFTRKYKAFSKEATAVDRKIDLSKNFRSRREVLESVNDVFGAIMSEELGDVAYDEHAALYPGRDFPAPLKAPVELNVLFKSDESSETSEDNELAEMASVEREARVIGARILGLMEESVIDAGPLTYRKPRYRDIVLLMRATSSRKKVFEEVFAEMGIPLYVDGGDGYFQTIEIKMVMSLLRLVDNARQDIHLITVMRSPFGGFTMEELLEIRLLARGEGGKAFYDSLMKLAAEPTSTDEGDSITALKQKVQQFLAQLRQWQEDALDKPLDEFIWSVMMTSGFYHYISAMNGGREREANLRLLVERAGAYEKQARSGLFNFIRYTEKMEKNAGDLDTAKIIGESDDVVRLMSIHKSKGLEFPIVIVAACGSRFNTRDLSEPMMLDKDLGLALRFVDLEKRTVTESLPQIALRLKNRRELLSEEMRILYVAMTRAVDRLLIYGTVRKKEAALEKWQRGCVRANLMRASSLLDWLGMAWCQKTAGIEALSDTAADFKGMRLQWLGEGALIEAKAFLERGVDVHLQKTSSGALIQEREPLESTAYQQIQTEVKRRLSSIYAHEAAAELPFKASVTELVALEKSKRRKALNIPTIVPMPACMQAESALDAATAGTLYHKVLQVVSLQSAIERLQDESYMAGKIENMMSRGILPTLPQGTLNSRVITDFFKTDLALRMMASRAVHREKSFVVRHKVENEEVLVQGIIDCFFEEEDGLVVMDYKTGGAAFSSHEAVQEAYGLQVESYGNALRKITGRSVKEGWVVLLERGWTVRIF